MLKNTKQDLDVSRETMERLELFVQLVEKWTKRVNLISKSSVKDIWARHILDSYQIALLGGNLEKWVDVGSGAGFPGIVVAAVAQEKHPKYNMTLVESDQRKAAFLRMAAREMDIKVTVLSERVEAIPHLGATTMSARALAPFSELLGYAHTHLAPEGVGVFPKGATWEKEVQDASDRWSFSYNAIRSQTDPAAAILVVQDIEQK